MSTLDEIVQQLTELPWDNIEGNQENIQKYKNIIAEKQTEHLCVGDCIRSNSFQVGFTIVKPNVSHNGVFDDGIWITIDCDCGKEWTARILPGKFGLDQ